MKGRVEIAEAQPGKRRRKLGARDGLFQRGEWWWIDYADAEGKRHRKKAAPDYQAARLIYRDTVAKIARGEVLGVREEGIRLRDFVERRYWPTIRPMLSLWEQKRAWGILETQILPRFGGLKLVGLRREEIERWQAERREKVSGSTANKELMRFGHVLNRAVTRLYILAALQTGARRGELAGLTRAFARLCHDLKLLNLRFHDLRHEAASTLTMAGVPQRTVMAILGHRDPRMTMRYQHLTPEHLREARARARHSAARGRSGRG